MKAPRFWYPETPGTPWQARVFAPLAALYAAATRHRVAQSPDHRAGVPVICIGNLTAGGAGKTPTAIALAEWLSDRGRSPGIVSRGYGGTEQGPIRVDPTGHTAEQVGDEPLLLAAFAPVWVSKDRAAGVRAAESGGADIILLDDGFQNPSVAKDLSLVVVDAAVGFGNGRVIPAGPLREPVETGLERAQAVLSVGAPSAQSTFATDWGDRIRVPMLTATLEPLPTGLPLKGRPVLAFAGIARPERFFDTLRALGADIQRAEALGDHQTLTPALMSRLEAEAQKAGAQMVTTEKDAVRLPASFRQKVMTVPVRLRFDDPNVVETLFSSILDPQSTDA